MLIFNTEFLLFKSVWWQNSLWQTPILSMCHFSHVHPYQPLSSCHSYFPLNPNLVNHHSLCVSTLCGASLQIILPPPVCVLIVLVCTSNHSVYCLYMVRNSRFPRAWSDGLTKRALSHHTKVIWSSEDFTSTSLADLWKPINQICWRREAGVVAGTTVAKLV